MITRPCYCSRDEVMRAIDTESALVTIARLDRALASAAEKIEGELHRIFFPWDRTIFRDWPNYDYADPWQLWLGENDLLCLTDLQSPSGQAIPLGQVFLRPLNPRLGWPYTHIELDRSTSAAWGVGPTPQASIWATGTWGFTGNADAAGALTSAIDTTTSTLTLDDGSIAGAGDVLIIGYGRGSAPDPDDLSHAASIAPYVGERVICSDKTTTTTGLTQTGPGCTTSSAADNALTTTGAGALNPGEILLLDQEQMLVLQADASGVIVRRAWAGTVLQAHTDATVYAYRQYTVIRGQLGTPAAAATLGTGVYRHRPPQLIRDLAIAEAISQPLQEVAGYSRMVGVGEGQVRASGLSLADLWDEAYTTYGRQRVGAI